MLFGQFLNQPEASPILLVRKIQGLLSSRLDPFSVWEDKEQLTPAKRRLSVRGKPAQISPLFLG
jgi:hypothetical protein